MTFHIDRDCQDAFAEGLIFIGAEGVAVIEFAARSLEAPSVSAGASSADVQPLP